MKNFDGSVLAGVALVNALLVVSAIVFGCSGDSNGRRRRPTPPPPPEPECREIMLDVVDGKATAWITLEVCDDGSWRVLRREIKCR
jgi:hypothetical protein